MSALYRSFLKFQKPLDSSGLSGVLVIENDFITTREGM
jgi:hypothetical protein